MRGRSRPSRISIPPQEVVPNFQHQVQEPVVLELLAHPPLELLVELPQSRREVVILRIVKRLLIGANHGEQIPGSSEQQIVVGGIDREAATIVHRGPQPIPHPGSLGRRGRHHSAARRALRRIVVGVVVGVGIHRVTSGSGVCTTRVGATTATTTALGRRQAGPGQLVRRRRRPGSPSRWLWAMAMSWTCLRLADRVPLGVRPACLLPFVPHHHCAVADRRSRRR